VSLESAEISQWSRVFATEDQYIVAPIQNGGIQLYAKTGRLRKTTLSDLVSADWNLCLEPSGDTVYVFDPKAEKAWVLDQEGRVLDGFHIPRGSSFRVLHSGDIAFTANRRTRKSFGHPWHILKRDGEVTSYGVEACGRGLWGRMDPF
jgi:hypothetical protein